MPTLFLLLALLAAPSVKADAGTCYTIADQDARTFCLARAHGDVGRCYAIRAPDVRARCRAEVGQ